MFARRNLRRNFVIVTCLPIFLLGVYIIHQNREIVLPGHSTYQNREIVFPEHSKYQNREIVYSEHSKDQNREITSPERSKDQNREIVSPEHSKDQNREIVSSEHSKDQNRGIVSSEHSKDQNREIVSPEHSKDQNREIVSSEHSKDQNRGIVSSEHSKDQNREIVSPEHSKDQNREIASREHSKDQNREIVSPERSKDQNREIVHPEHSKDQNREIISREHSKDQNREIVSLEHSKNQNREIVSPEHSKDQNREIVYPEHSKDQHQKSIFNFSEEINKQYGTRLTRSTSRNSPSTVPIDEEVKTENIMNINVPKIPFVNNYKQLQEFKPFQPFQPFQQIQQITHPVIDTKNLERFVHLDLKGAAPIIDYYKKLFPFLKQLGATGLLIEYEDMFPFTNHLSIIKHGLTYTKEDVQQILQLAKHNGLKVMPLLQVYGHLEYVLKLKEFVHLREDRRYPQVITPCLEESYKLIFDMIDQMLSLHPSIPYLHMGCDEVYYRFVHPECANIDVRDDADLFIRHVTRIAKYIKLKRPRIKLFIWHDMLTQLVNSGDNDMTELTKLIIPMVWTYVDDVKTWFDESIWMSFSMFREVWVASSFKGSSGEITTMSYIGHHQRNQQTWLETMYTASSRHKVNFTGIAITGWSRYDHMLSLCELIPSSIPSLAYVLQTIVHGSIDHEKKLMISSLMLGCNQIPLWEKSTYYTYMSCKFPGHEMYEIMYQYDGIIRQYEETMSFVRLYLTDIHLRQNYIHYKRSEECLQRLISLEEQMIDFIESFQIICLKFFTPDIGPEWLQTYLMRKFKEVQYRINFIERTLKTQISWPKRPLPNNTAPIIVKRRNRTMNRLSQTF